MTSEANIPDWYQSTLDLLFTHISIPVSEIFPDFSPADTQLMTRGLFSSVHGVVLLGLQQRASSAEISRMLTLILSNTHQNKIF